MVSFDAVTTLKGVQYEVAWTLQANHGGGYSYRLCPLGEELTEACFQKYPLDFVGQSTFRWGGKGGRELRYNATTVSTGTSPAGSMWRKNPIPRSWRDKDGNWGQGSNQFQTGEGFQPLCEDNVRDSSLSISQHPLATSSTSVRGQCTGLFLLYQPTPPSNEFSLCARTMYGTRF
jgi:hypothetical protein